MNARTADHDHIAYLPSALTPTHVVTIEWPGSGVERKPMTHSGKVLVMGVKEAHETAERIGKRSPHLTVRAELAS